MFNSVQNKTTRTSRLAEQKRKTFSRSVFLCLTAVSEAAVQCWFVFRKMKLHHYLRRSWPANYELLPTPTIKPHSRHICREAKSSSTKNYHHSWFSADAIHGVKLHSVQRSIKSTKSCHNQNLDSRLSSLNVRICSISLFHVIVNVTTLGFTVFVGQFYWHFLIIFGILRTK